MSVVARLHTSLATLGLTEADAVHVGPHKCRK